MFTKWFSNGMKMFVTIWFGQLISQMGTAMTRFALLIWAYQHTGKATTLALLGFFSLVPYIAATPLAGVLIDRWDRRRVMMLADTGAGLMTLVMLVLYTTGSLQIWHLYLAEAIAGICEAFQVPAYSTSVTLLVPRDQLPRASGMRSLSYSLSRVVAPFLGGLLLTFIDINGVMLIDIATFVIAVSIMLTVRIPRPAVSEDAHDADGTLFQQIQYGFAYIWQRPGLMGLLGFFAIANFVSALTYFGILPAMILSRSGGSELALATIQSMLGIGGVLGGLLFSMWGGFKRRIHNILLGAALSFILGDLVFAFGRSLPFWMAAALMGEFWIPLIVGGDRTIWQTKVPADIQGRVFAAQDVVREIAFPIGYLITGPLADRVMEPAMAAGGSLAPIFGSLIGTGPGAGMALMFVFTGILGSLSSLACYLIRPLRDVETDLQDAVVVVEGGREVAMAESSA